MEKAKVIQMHKSATWDAVRDAWAKAQSLGFAAVLEAARVGEMLIELKAGCEHGEWDANVNRALQTKSARQTAFNLMTLARNLPLLEQHKPDSQRQALKLIADSKPKTETAKPKQPKPRAYSREWRAVLIDAFNMPTTQLKGGAVKQRIEAKIGGGYVIPGKFTSSSDADAFVALYRDRVGVKVATAEKVITQVETTVPEGKREQFAKAVEKAANAERAALRLQFNDEVHAQVQKQVATSLAFQRRKLAEDQLALEKDKARHFTHLASGLTLYMTEAEYDLVRNCLHPDRAPEDRRDRFAKAFAIFTRLAKLGPQLPPSEFKRRGWSGHPGS